MDDKVIAMMRSWGATAESIELAESLRDRARQDADVFELWPENHSTFSFFLRVSAQWCYAGFDAARACLNLPAIEVVARAEGIRGRAWRELLQALQLIEREVLDVDAERRESRLVARGKG